MIRIKFSDIDWIDSDAKIIKMSLEHNLYLNSRLTHNYTPPVITEDSWNGKTFPVQKNIWDSYLIEFHVKELAINAMAKMQSCENITILDLVTNEEIEVDTSNSGSITMEAGDRFMTSGQSFNLIVKSRKISLYPGISRLNTNCLQIIRGTSTYPFYTDKEIINYVSDSEKSQFDNEDGLIYTAKTISKNGRKMVFYLMETDANELKKQVENIGFTSVCINPNLEANYITEVGKVGLTLLAEGLYRCEVDLVINTNLNYA